jgi:protein-disulfide isomerase
MLRTFKIMFITLLATFSLPSFADTIGTLLNGTNDPIIGNKKGQITVVEFFDYQCSHCSNMAPILKNIVKKNPNVRLVLKEFPILGPLSEYAARAALAANKQGKYSSFNHSLMTTRYTLTESTINDIAKNNGVNISQLKKDMSSNTITNQINTNFKLGRELGLNGTPVFFIGKTNANSVDELHFITGEASQTKLQNIIDNVNK